jgi:hypothetical protein
MKAKVNLTMDKEVWRQFRVQCLQHDTSASAEFEAFMKTRLQQWEQKGRFAAYKAVVPFMKTEGKGEKMLDRTTDAKKTAVKFVEKIHANKKGGNKKK